MYSLKKKIYTTFPTSSNSSKQRKSARASISPNHHILPDFWKHCLEIWASWLTQIRALHHRSIRTLGLELQKLQSPSYHGHVRNTARTRYVVSFSQASIYGPPSYPPTTPLY